MCTRDNCLVDERTTEFLKKDLASQKKNLTEIIEDLPARFRRRLLEEFDTRIESIAGKPVISNAINEILTNTFSEKHHLSVNPRHILELNNSYASKSFTVLIEQELKDLLSSRLDEKSRSKIVHAYASYMISYAYSIILCFDVRIEDSPHPLGLTKFEGALTALAKGILAHEESTPELRSKVIGENTYFHRHYMMEKFANFYAENTPLASMNAEEIFYILNEANFPEGPLESLFKRADEAPDVINDFIQTYPHFLYYKYSLLFPFVKNHPTSAGLSALIYVAFKEDMVTKEQLQKRASKIIDILLKKFPKEVVISTKDAHSLLSVYGMNYIASEEMKALASNANFQQDGNKAWQRYFGVSGIDERTLIAALSIPGLEVEVFVSPSSTARVLSYANKVNADRGCGYEEVLMGHANQSKRYILHAIRGGSEFAESAVMNKALTADEVIDVLKDIKNPELKAELCVAFARRQDLFEGHAHYAMKHGGVNAYNALAKNNSVLVTEQQFNEIQG